MKVAIAALVALTLFALAPPATPGAPATCAEDCAIDANAFAYQPPVATLDTGASVTWRSQDTTHVTLDGTGFEATEPCFVVVHHPSADAPAVRFDVAGGALTATVGTDGPKVCASASPLPDGAFVMPYYCSLHPTMHGVLIVAG